MFGCKQYHQILFENLINHKANELLSEAEILVLSTDLLHITSGKGRPQLKKIVFFRALPKSPNPPSPQPQYGQLGPFFGRQNSRFESHLWGGEGDISTTKKQSKVQYIGIFEEIDSFY